METTPLQAAIEDGLISTSSEFGVCWIARIIYNTDPEGKVVAEDDDSNVTLHGPFDTEKEAIEWADYRTDGDTDVRDIDAIVLNKVR